MAESKKKEGTRRLIVRQRVSPRIWDYSYLYLRSNLAVFRAFAEMVAWDGAAGGGRRKILDAGCGFRPWARFFDDATVRLVGIDHDRGSADADALASGDALPFKDGRFDALICSEVLEHAADPDRVIGELRRVARDGALVFISSPFVFPEHGLPHDYQRLTRSFYMTAFRRDEIVVLEASNTAAATAVAALNLAFEASPVVLLEGVKQVVYAVVNAAARLVDLAVSAFIGLLPAGKRGFFASMPLGYALIVRIRK